MKEENSFMPLGTLKLSSKLGGSDGSSRDSGVSFSDGDGDTRSLVGPVDVFLLGPRLLPGAAAASVVNAGGMM